MKPYSRLEQNFESFVVRPVYHRERFQKKLVLI